MYNNEQLIYQIAEDEILALCNAEAVSHHNT